MARPPLLVETDSEDLESYSWWDLMAGKPPGDCDPSQADDEVQPAQPPKKPRRRRRRGTSRTRRREPRRRRGDSTRTMVLLSMVFGGALLTCGLALCM